MWPKVGVELRIFGIGSRQSTNRATTTALLSHQDSAHFKIIFFILPLNVLQSCKNMECLHKEETEGEEICLLLPTKEFSLLPSNIVRTNRTLK